MYKKAIKDNSKIVIPFLQGIKNKETNEIISNVDFCLRQSPHQSRAATASPQGEA